MSGFFAKLEGLFSGPQPPVMATAFSVPPPGSNPEQVQSEWIRELSEFNAQFLSQMGQLQAAVPLLGAVGTQAVVAYLGSAITNLEAFRPKAEWLSKAGLPDMSTGLDSILADAKKAYEIHQETLGKWAKSDAANAATMNKSEQDTTASILQQNVDRLKTYGDANDRWGG